MSTFERAAIAGAASYLVVLGVAMQRLSYDIWGALVIVPVLVVISVPLIRKAFSGSLAPLQRYAWLGLFVKFAGAYAGYQVRFESYGGAADAGRYHNAGKLLAGGVRDGSESVLAVLPTGSSTLFLEQLTGLVYTVVGSSRLGGFMVFAWMSYWGLVFFVKAAAVAVPGLATRRYTLLIFLLPSLVYWGSSIGKEAFTGLCLGVASYGIALVLGRSERHRLGFALAAVSLIAAARVRPHFAAVWVGAAVIALVGRAALDLTRRAGDGRSQFRFSTIVVAVIALIGFGLVATATLNLLEPVSKQDDASVAVSDRVASIFSTVESRTNEGGSTFTPISTSSPTNWPVAAFRTLTRPLLFEASGLAGLLPALEMTALLAAAAVGWRRFVNIPKLLLTTPYLVFALICVFTFGVAFASIGNLGILVRQRSLVLPLLLLFWCVPPIGAGRDEQPDENVEPTGRPESSNIYSSMR